MRFEIDAGAAVAHLAEVDPRLGAVIGRVGAFTLRPDPEEPFHSLLRAITYQQLSGKAAATIFSRFLALFAEGATAGEPPTPWTHTDVRFPAPQAVLALEDEAMRSAGLSRQKIASIRDLAVHAAAGELAPDHIAGLDDEAVIEHLTRVRGVGRWTAEMYLLFHLGRPDVLPVNDLGINRAIERLYDLPALPKPDEVRRIGAPWRPWASVACWYLWRSLEVVTLEGGGPGRT